MTNNSPSTSLKVSPRLFKKHALNCIRSKTPFMVWGNPGIGKSEILKALVESLGYHFEDIRLSQIDSIDLRGLPSKDGEVGNVSVVWAVPDFLKRAREIKAQTGKNTAFFFDEINSGSPATMAAAYQFINDRRIGPHELGADDIVFAAGNLDTDGGITNTMPTPLCNRFRHYTLRVDVESFLEYAAQTNGHPWVVGYLSITGNANKLQMFDPEKIMGGDEKAYATPRTWMMLSKALKVAYPKHNSDGMDDVIESDVPWAKEISEDLEMKMEDLSAIAASCIGSGVSVEFAAYVKEGMDLPKAKDILSGKITKSKESLADSPSKQFFISNDCCYALKEYDDKIKAAKEKDKNADIKGLQTEYMKAMENFVLFAKASFGPEMFIFGVVSTMIKRFRLFPQPGVMSKSTFDLIISEFEKAKTK